MNKFKITIDGNNYDVTVNLTDHHKANVEVNGISYDVSYESKNTVAAPIRKSTAPRYPTGTCFSTGCCSIQCHQYQKLRFPERS